MQNELHVLSLLMRKTTWEFSKCEVIANSTQMRLCTKWKNKARLGVGRESPFSIPRPLRDLVTILYLAFPLWSSLGNWEMLPFLLLVTEWTIQLVTRGSLSDCECVGGHCLLLRGRSVAMEDLCLQTWIITERWEKDEHLLQFRAETETGWWEAGGMCGTNFAA